MKNPAPRMKNLNSLSKRPKKKKNTSSTTSEAPVKKSVENCLKFLDCVGHKFREQSENNIILYVEMQKATSTMELNDREEENIAKMKTGKKWARNSRQREGEWCVRDEKERDAEKTTEKLLCHCILPSYRKTRNNVAAVYAAGDGVWRVRISRTGKCKRINDAQNTETQPNQKKCVKYIVSASGEIREKI